MLYNPKWEEKHHPLSIPALVAWLEKQDPAKHYVYSDPGRCMARQYNDSIGRKYTTPVAGLLDFFFSNFDSRLERIAMKGEHTFGAALERARAHL